MFVVLNAIQWGYVALRVRPTTEPIPLHYTTTFGIDRIGPWYSAYLLPLSGSLIVLANIAFLLVAMDAQRTTGRVIIGLTIFMQLILAVAAFLIDRFSL